MKEETKKTEKEKEFDFFKETELCPQCGVGITPETKVCPNCGLNLQAYNYM
ncbi:hypothetical protein JW698_01920 [Candidatus Wolfebacteria bacterium]|nr:hypothetical protein [Candidatus Wolfebacteria bacterium]